LRALAAVQLSQNLVPSASAPDIRDS
jgi:hypothetical protein